MGEVTLGGMQTWPVRGLAASPELSGNVEPPCEKSDRSHALPPAGPGRRVREAIWDTPAATELLNVVAPAVTTIEQHQAANLRNRKNQCSF